MIDAFAIPVLMKAVDFLFGEVKEIMEDRRLARKQVEKNKKDEIPLLGKSKDEVMKAKVSEQALAQRQQAIQGTLEELIIYHANYQRLKKRVALDGGIDYTDVSIANQLRLQEDALIEVSQKLGILIDGLTKTP
jgi:hypothetical protein